MRYFFIFLTITLSICTVAQRTEDSVKAVVNTMFAAMKAADGNALKATFADKAILQTIGRDRQGKTIVENDTVSSFADLVSSLKKDSADERISFETIRIDGPLAMVWAPYNFYFNGVFSHCGVDCFELVRLNGTWKIQYLIDTRRRAGCKP